MRRVHSSRWGPDCGPPIHLAYHIYPLGLIQRYSSAWPYPKPRYIIVTDRSRPRGLVQNRRKHIIYRTIKAAFLSKTAAAFLEAQPSLAAAHVGRGRRKCAACTLPDALVVPPSRLNPKGGQSLAPLWIQSQRRGATPKNQLQMPPRRPQVGVRPDTPDHVVSAVLPHKARRQSRQQQSSLA